MDWKGGKAFEPVGLFDVQRLRACLGQLWAIENYPEIQVSEGGERVVDNEIGETRPDYEGILW